MKRDTNPFRRLAGSNSSDRRERIPKKTRLPTRHCGQDVTVSDTFFDPRDVKSDDGSMAITFFLGGNKGKQERQESSEVDFISANFSCETREHKSGTSESRFQVGK